MSGIISSVVKSGWGMTPDEAAQRITNGVDNENYKVVVDGASYVLTKVLDLDATKCYGLLAFVAALEKAGIAVAKYRVTRGGSLLMRTEYGTVTLAEWVEGDSPVLATVAQCKAIARELGKIHSIGLDYPAVENKGIFDNFSACTREVFARLPLDEAVFFESAFQNHVDVSDGRLQRSFCHRDLFRDNALMQDSEVGAVIDFFSSGQDAMLFDVATLLLDWAYLSDTQEFCSVRWLCIMQSYMQTAPSAMVDELPMLYKAVGYVAMVVWMCRYQRLSDNVKLSGERTPADMYHRLQVLTRTPSLADIRL